MDPSTPAAQDAQNQSTSTQQVTNNTQPVSPIPPAKPVTQPVKTQISVSGSGGLEAGSAMIVAEDPDADEEDEDIVKVARQETKNQVVTGLGGDEQSDEQQQLVSAQSVVDVQEAEVQPAVPEVVAGSPEVEKIIEVTPPDAPRLTQELKKVGVTHSGPGFIDVSQTGFTPPKPPVSFDQAYVEEKKTDLHDSRHWLMGKIMYLWRKINPNIVATVKKKVVKKVVPAGKTPVPAASPVAVKTNPAPATVTQAAVNPTQAKVNPDPAQGMQNQNT